MIPGLSLALETYLEEYPCDRDRLALLLSQVESGEDYAARSNMRGHVVSSVITLDPSRTKALLIHHLAYGLWIPPGGHYDEADSRPTIYESALRERFEETGLQGTRPAGGRPCLIDIDTHPIPPRPAKDEGAHYHHDFMFLELLDNNFTPIVQIDEISGVRWRPLAEMAAEGGRASRLAERIAALPPAMLV